jgi:hypothetical protein
MNITHNEHMHHISVSLPFRWFKEYRPFKHHWLHCVVSYHWFWENDTTYSLMMWTHNWPYITSATFSIVKDIPSLEIYRDDRDGRILLKWTQKTVINVWTWPISKLQQMMLKNVWIALLDHLHISLLKWNPTPHHTIIRVGSGAGDEKGISWFQCIISILTHQGLDFLHHDCQSIAAASCPHTKWQQIMLGHLEALQFSSIQFNLFSFP